MNHTAAIKELALEAGSSGGTARRTLRFACLACLAVATTGCRFVNPSQSTSLSDDPQSVVGAAGWTRIASTPRYIVVANVLPGEEMFTGERVRNEHPTVGELVIAGAGNPLGPNVRHVEAHIYDRSTGLPLSNVRPSISVLNRSTGKRTSVPPTLMQDVNSGARDVHYGNNIAVAGDSDLSITVTIGEQEVTLDGHLD